MKYEYEKKCFISYTNVDDELKLGLTNSVFILQDIVTEYFGSIESDNCTTKNQNEAVWVVTKTKVHFNKYPRWRDTIKGKVCTTKLTPIRVEVETQFKDEKGETLFLAKQESCPIDINTRKIRKINTISYPKDMEVQGTVIPEAFFKLNEKFDESDLAYKQVVYYSDIDYSKHVNNAIYVRYIINALSCEFLDKCQITDFEIHYISEAKEGQELKVYKKMKGNEIDFLIKENEREIVRAKILYCPE